MGVNGKQNNTRNIIFQQKNEKNREKTGKKQGKNTKKQEKNRKLQEIQKQDFDKISEHAENGNENKNEVFSNVTINDSRAKTMYPCKPSLECEPVGRRSQP